MRQTIFSKVSIGAHFRFIRTGAVFLKTRNGWYRLASDVGGPSEYEAAGAQVYVEVK
jgi:hypothetical protein